MENPLVGEKLVLTSEQNVPKLFGVQIQRPFHLSHPVTQLEVCVSGVVCLPVVLGGVSASVLVVLIRTSEEKLPQPQSKLVLMSVLM